MVVQFARGLPVLKRALQFLVPKNELGKIAAGPLLARYAPEVMYAGIQAGLAPEGTDLGTRLAMGGEDLMIGLGSSLLGQAGGYALGKRIIPGIRGKSLSGMTKDQVGRLQNIMTYGDIAAGPLNIFSPRPITSSVYENLNEEAAAQQEAQVARQTSQRDQALIQPLIGSGVITSAALGMPVRMPTSAVGVG